MNPKFVTLLYCQSILLFSTKAFITFKPVSRVSVKFLLTLGVNVMGHLANFWLTRKRMRNELLSAFTNMIGWLKVSSRFCKQIYFVFFVMDIWCVCMCVLFSCFNRHLTVIVNEVSMLSVETW